MSWQHDVLAALQARDARDKAFEPFVERYQRATALASALKRTNGALVAAAASAQPDEVEPAAAATATTTTLNKRDESKSSSKRTANSSAASVSSHGKSEQVQRSARVLAQKLFRGPSLTVGLSFRFSKERL